MEIVNVTSIDFAPLKLINPNNPDSSVIYLKIIGDSSTGSLMPPGGTLKDENIDKIDQQLFKLIKKRTVIVKKMLTDPEYLDTKKDIIIEPSAGIKKIVAPNIRPLDVVKMATKQGVSTYKNQSTYLFYENLRGFNFRTLASMYNLPSQIEYTTFVPGTNTNKEGYPEILRDLSTILQYEIISNNDSIVNYRAGMYASKLIVHDIMSKSYETTLYNYHDNFENEHHIVGGVTEGKPEFPIVNDNSVTRGFLRNSDFYARTYVMPTTKVPGDDGVNDGQHNNDLNGSSYRRFDPENFVQSRNSQMLQLEKH